MTIEELLSFAPKLREAGILEVEAKGKDIIRAVLSEYRDTEADSPIDDGDTSNDLDPMDDPSSFPGGRVPSYDLSRIRREE